MAVFVNIDPNPITPRIGPDCSWGPLFDSLLCICDQSISYGHYLTTTPSLSLSSYPSNTIGLQFSSPSKLIPIQRKTMANSSKQTQLLILFFTIIYAAHLIQGSRTQVGVLYTHRVMHFTPSEKKLPLQGFGEQWKNKNSRRVMIGSTAPTCTYNECRGCKYKCRAEQVPVEGNDPINSAYHYRCVCHR